MVALATQLVVSREVLRPYVARIGREHDLLPHLLSGCAGGRGRPPRHETHGPRSRPNVLALHRSEPPRHHGDATRRRRIAVAGARGGQVDP